MSYIHNAYKIVDMNVTNASLIVTTVCLSHLRTWYIIHKSFSISILCDILKLLMTLAANMMKIFYNIITYASMWTNVNISLLFIQICSSHQNFWSYWQHSVTRMQMYIAFTYFFLIGNCYQHKFLTALNKISCWLT